MAIDFKKWDDKINTPDFAKQVKEAANKNKKEFDEVPFGNYYVSIEKMELKESSTGRPMFTAWFKVKSDEDEDRTYKDALIFMNQLVEQPFQIHIVNEFLRKLETSVEVEFESYAQWSNVILDVHEECEGIEVLLRYYETKKGYTAFDIDGVYDAE